MKFGPVPTKDALGAILAHSMDAMQRPYAHQMSYRLRKGKHLTADDLADLLEEGHETIIVAQPGPDDVLEDDAAARLAAALVPDADAVGLRLSPASTGRVNIYAQSAGVAVIDSAKITALNAIDPMITVATVPAHHRMAADGMVATIKIIAYAVPETSLKAAIMTGPALSLAPAQFVTATLIETTYAPHVPLPDKGRRVMQGRVQRFGMQLTARDIVMHDTNAITEAVANAPGEIVMILTESATSDLLDVAPEAVRQAGGTITRFGMPVDPGNLLFLGEVAGKPVIGLPGCARSPVMNGADWVLERLICGVPVSDADIAGLGVGGLLKESPARHHPRRGAIPND